MPPRQVNGIQRPPGQNGPMLNGVPPANAMPGQQPQMPNGIPNAYPGAIPRPNGVPGAPPSNGPAVGTPAQQPMVPGQRPPMAPQRAPNGQPFRSPTMAPSPQNSGMQQPGQQPNTMAGPSGPPPPMNRGPMPPPNGQPGMPPQMVTPHFQQLGQPTSQPNSPAAAQGLTARSPSLANRQLRPQDQARHLQEAAINSDLLRIESSKLPELKQEAGLAHKDLPSLTMDDKVRALITIFFALTLCFLSATDSRLSCESRVFAKGSESNAAQRDPRAFKPALGAPNAAPRPTRTDRAISADGSRPD